MMMMMMMIGMVSVMVLMTQSSQVRPTGCTVSEHPPPFVSLIVKNQLLITMYPSLNTT